MSSNINNYSSQTFIVPLQVGEQTLKLRNTLMVTTVIIREADCTIKVESNIITIKQSSEGQLVKLQFSSINDAQSAHVLLRQALLQLKGQQSVPVPPSPTQQIKPSLDQLWIPTSTTQNGQWPGTPGLADQVLGSQVINVFVNGLKTEIGNGCTSSDFTSPQFDLVFAKRYSGFTRLSAVTIQLVQNDFILGDSVICTDNGITKCFDIIAIAGNIITLSGPTVGPISTLHKPKRWGQILKGDQILWFGSYSGYQLDTNDRIGINYLT